MDMTVEKEVAEDGWGTAEEEFKGVPAGSRDKEAEDLEKRGEGDDLGAECEAEEEELVLEDIVLIPE